MFAVGSVGGRDVGLTLQVWLEGPSVVLRASPVWCCAFANLWVLGVSLGFRGV